jgi:hypothetical protein
MIKNSKHLQQVLQNVSKVKGVYKAVRGRGRTGAEIRDSAGRNDFSDAR